MTQEQQDLFNELKRDYDEVLTTSELQEKYEVLGFGSPYVVVKRKSDGVKGSLRFTHMPRFYYDFCKTESGYINL